MKLLMTYLALLFIAGLACLAGCRKPATNTANQIANSNASSPTLEAPVGGAAMTGERFYFRGTIASNLRIEMTIVRNHNELTGSYFYPRVGKNIALTGTIDNVSNVELRETDASGKETGVFKGRWKESTEEPTVGLNRIEGKWSRPDSSKETAFALTQQPIEFTADVRVTPKTIKEANKEKLYTVDAEYPQIEGDARFDKFNREARGLVIKDVAAFKTAETQSAEETGELPTETTGSYLDIGYDIRYATDDLISVEFGAGQYSRGAAHPNSATAVLNYDVRHGKKLSLADLFNANSNYLNVISAYCIKALKDRAKKDRDGMLTDDTIQTGASPRADNYRAVSITKRGLWVTFDPYQVAPYAAGPQFVMVPYSTLKDIIKPDGPIGSLPR